MRREGNHFMVKHKKKFKLGKHKLRNGVTRNAPPRLPRIGSVEDRGGSHLKQLGFTAAGAAGTALVGSFLAHEGWAPKTIATALATVGAGLAWKGDGSTIRSVGAGAMSAAGSQLALMLIDDHDHKKAAATAAVVQAQVAKKPANADALPPGSLESAFHRARSQLALVGGEDIAA
jgi:hypothetical protein